MNTPILLILGLAGLQATVPSRPGPHMDEGATLTMHPVEIPLPGGGTAVAERGTLRVRIVRSDPESKEIGVDVWRFRALEGASPEAPPIFQLNGGPGWPGLEPTGVRWEDDIVPMIRHADYVLVGQRGIGTSTDTSCNGPWTSESDPLALDASLEERAAEIRRRCRECRAHWEGLGYDLSGLNVLEAADDVDDVRRLLGYDQIAILGGSFGSHWGMAVLRRHPESVARALLHGMEGPDHTYDMPSGVLGSLRRMAEAAEASPQLAGQVPEEGLIEAFAAMVESVEEEPVELEVRHPRTGAPTTVRLDAEALRSFALGYTTRVNSRGGMPGWPADLLRLLRGDFEQAARALLSNQDVELPTASFFMLDCGSGISRARLEVLRADPAAKVVGDLGWWYQTACSVWDSDLGEDFRAGFTTDVPTLVVHGTWDVNTPFDNALECLSIFRNLTFVPVVGGSHGAFGEAIELDDDFRAAAMRFLTTGSTEGLPREIVLPPIAWVVPS